MKTEKLGKTNIILADEGKCFKGDNVDSIITTLFLGKFDNIKNYEEVDIDTYQNELNMLHYSIDDTMSTLDIEAAIIEDTLEPDIDKLGE